VTIALVRWRQGLQDLAKPTREEANQAGRDLLLLVLQEMHPDYIEPAREEGASKKPETTALDLALGYLEGMLSPDYSTGEDEIFETALEGTRLLKALGESSEFPYPYVKLPYVPSLIFPLKNAETGERIWVEIAPTNYGFVVTAHRRKPRTHDVATPSRATAMGGIHVDYYVVPQPMENPLTRRGTPRQRWKRPQEILQIQVFDDVVGPYDESHWVIPDDYSASEPEASILLVRDVRWWRAPREGQVEADVAVHQEIHAADVLSYPAEKGDSHA